MRSRQLHIVVHLSIQPASGSNDNVYHKTKNNVSQVSVSVSVCQCVCLSKTDQRTVAVWQYDKYFAFKSMHKVIMNHAMQCCDVIDMRNIKKNNSEL